MGGSHASTLECLHDCLLDIMFLFYRIKLILILILFLLTTFIETSFLTMDVNDNAQSCTFMCVIVNVCMGLIAMYFKTLY